MELTGRAAVLKTHSASFVLCLSAVIRIKLKETLPLRTYPLLEILQDIIFCYVFECQRSLKKADI